MTLLLFKQDLGLPPFCRVKADTEETQRERKVTFKFPKARVLTSASILQEKNCLAIFLWTQLGWGEAGDYR